MSPEQSRAARGWLRMKQTALADLAGVCPETVKRFERRMLNPHPSNLCAMRAALESAGITFLPNGITMGNP